MVEWFKAAVLKTAEAQVSEGSNPSLSAIEKYAQQKLRFFLCLRDRDLCKMISHFAVFALSAKPRTLCV